MAFDFLGTLSKAQLNEFRNYLEEQIVDITEEVNYLYAENNNLEQTLTNFMTADNILGNSFSLNVQSIRTQFADIVSVPKQDDSVAASLIADIKDPFISTIKQKKERNEYKIKKLIDIIEQNREMIDLKSVAKSATKSQLDELDKMFNSSNAGTLFNSEEDKVNYMQGIVKQSNTTTTGLQ